MTPFAVDTNYFIQAHRIHYPMDVVPGFWTKTKELADSGRVVSIDKVKVEIFKYEDQLRQWCIDNLPTGFFMDTTSSIAEYIEITNWANSKNYTHTALANFMDSKNADAYLIAHCMKNHCTLVTHEISAPDSKKNIKIPDACLAKGVDFVNTIGMFRKLGERF